MSVTYADEDDPIVVFQRDFVPLCQGDVLAALMLSQIYYWYRPTKYGKSKLKVFKQGKWWLAKSTKDWEAELGMTPKQARRCIAVLQELGIIETVLLKFDGAPVTHLRFTFVEGHEVLNCPEQVIHLTSGKVSFSPKGKSLTENTTQPTTQTNGMNANDILKQHQQGKAGKAQALVESTKPVTVGDLAMLWKKRVSLEYGPMKDLIAKEMGQLKHVLKGMGQGSKLTTDWCVSHWPTFVNGVKQAKGIHSVPETPDIGFFCKYYDIGENLRLAQLIAKKPDPVAIVAPTKPSAPAVAPPKPVATKATLAEVEATLAELLALKEAPK